MEEKKKYHYLRDGKKVEMTLEEARALNESIVRKKIVLTESDLKMMVKNCVRKVLSESEQRIMWEK